MQRLIKSKYKYCLAITAMLASAWMIQAQFTPSKVNRWTATADMAAPRAAACSARLADGSMLVAGGAGEGGALNSVELYGGDGKFTSVAPMLESRANAACVALNDGTVLVTGGNNGDHNLRTAEVFDPASGEWRSAGEMSVARSGHTATLSPWGAVIVAGGEESGVVEAFLTNGTFRTLGKLSTPRVDYALAALPTHKIVIAGGTHNGDALDTVEIFDADDNSIKAAGKMLAARSNFASAALNDGTVLLTGGFDSKGKALATTEIFDPVKGASIAGPVLHQARARHQATTLPNNGKVLITGGTGGTEPLAGTEIYTPWQGTLDSTAGMRNARTGAAGQAVRRGQFVIAGGRGESGPLAASEVYGFATIESAKPDYAPGESATLTGQGWKPGETVKLSVVSFPVEANQTEFTATAQADGNGQVRFADLKIDRSHSGARFLATATGSESSAQTLFTDATYATTTTLSLDSSSQPYGSMVTLTAKVTGHNPPAGNVQFFLDGSVLSGPQAINASGIATTSVSNVPVGTHSFYAVYAAYTDGTDTWNTSSAPVVTYNVTATTSITVAPISPNPQVGDMVTLIASLSATGISPVPGPNPINGTVTFRDTVTSLTIGSTSVTGTGIVTYSTNQFHAGAHTIVAEYANPGSGYSNATSSGVGFTTLRKSPPAYSITTSPVSPTVGDQVTLTFTVTAAVPGFIPTGNATFYVDGGPVSGSINLNSLTGTATYAYSQFTAGSHAVGVAYSGDSDYGSLNYVTATQNVTVAKANTTSSASTLPATPITYGQSVTLKGTVSGPASSGVGVNGTAEFRDNGSAISGATGLAVTNGSVSVTPVAALTAGLHPITLAYAGDSNYNSSISPSYSLQVNKAVPSTVLTSTSTNNLQIGSGLTLTATLTSPNTGSGPASGTVTFFDSGATAIPGCSNVAVSGSGPVTAACSFTFNGTSTPKSGGTHSYTATFNPGNANWDTATSNAIAATVAKKDPTVGPVTFTPSANATFDTNTTVYVTFSPASGAPALTGTVDFYDGATLLGSSAVVSGGDTTYALPTSVTQAVTTHTITATYIGDTNYNAKTSAPANFDVSKATPTFSTLTFPGVVTFGAPVSIPVTVSSATTVTPTGTVTFTGNSATLCTVTLASGSGTCNFNATQLAQGANTITVVYSGNTNFNTLTNSANSITIAKANTSGTLVTNPLTSANFGDPLSLTATFTPATSGTLTGTVDFYDGGAKLNSAGVTISSGQASYTLTSPLTPGSHATLYAVYSGDANFNTSTTPYTAITINPAATTTTVTPSATSVQLGSSVTYTVSVTAPAGAPTPITGSVDVKEGAVTLCNALLSGTPATGSCSVLYDGSTTQKQTGAHNIFATFNTGNSTNWANSNSGVTGVTVTAGVTTLSGLTCGPLSACSGGPSSFTLTGGYGTPVALRANISPANPSPAYTGRVTFSIDGVPTGSPVLICTAPGVPYGACTAAGQAVITNVILPGGTHTIAAAFGGDANWGPSDDPISIIVPKATLSSSSFHVTGATFTANYGGTLSAGTLAIDPAGSGLAPTGTVTLVSGASNFPGSFPLTGGTATVTGAQLPASLNAGNGLTLNFNYSGDSNYNAGSTSAPLNVAQVTPNRTLVSSQNPSAFGQSVTFTATVTNPTGTPTGTVTFNNGATVLGTAPLVNQSASFTTSSLDPGTHGITATYSGDTNFLSGGATTMTPAANQTVSGGNTQITLQYSPPNPTLNSTVIYSVTLTGGPTPPAGSVVLNDGATTVCSIPALTINASNSTGSCPVFYNAADAQHAGGAHNMSAVYNPTPGTCPGATNCWTAATSPVQVVNIGGVSTSISQPFSSFGSTLTYGNATTLTVQVSPSSPQPAYTALKVQFYDNGAPLGAPVGDPTGSASTAPLTLTAGTHNITAQFQGDSNYGASVMSVAQPITVNKATPAVSFVAPPFTAFYGQTLTSQITVAPVPGGATPTGGVTLSSGSTTLATGTLDGSGQFTFSNISLPASIPVGSHNLRVTYNGDGNHNSAFVDSTINVQASPVSVAITSPTLTSMLPNSPVYGQNLTFVATFTGPGSAATGNVDFMDGSNTICATAPIVNGVATCTQAATQVNHLGVSSHAITVTNFVNDSNHTLGTVSALGPFGVGLAQTTTVLTGTPNPSQPGQQVTFTATVSVAAPGVAPLTGTVTINNGSSALSVPCSNMTLSGNTATCNFTFPGAGPNNLTAIYAGDANTASSQGMLVQNVTRPAPLITSITPSPSNPTAYGQPVTFTAVVSVAHIGAAPPLPVGTLQFYDGANSLGGVQNIVSSDNTAHTVTYSITVPSGGLPVLSGGTHAISAIYIPGGDPNYSQGNSLTQPIPAVLQHVVSLSDSVTSNLTVTANPSNIVFGQAVTFSVDVAPAGTGNTGVPTGDVQFYDNGNPIGNPQPLLTVGTVQRATLANFAGLTRAAHNITARYLGNHTFNPSTTQVPTAVTVDYAFTKTVLAGFPASPQYGAPITLTAQVCGLAPGSADTCSATLPAAPHGTVSFFDGSTLLGTTGPVDNTGTASLALIMQNPQFTNPVIGAHTITAVYNGNGVSGSPDPNFKTSTSSSGTLSIGKGTTSSAVVSSANPSVTGQPITFTATVNAPASQSAPPTGAVTFQDGGVTLGTSAIVVNGGIAQAVLVVPSGSISALAVGHHVISVNYSGDANYNPSNSPLSDSALVQNVNKAGTTTQISSSSNQSNVGQQVTLTATVTVNSPGTGVPTGTVSFINTSAAPGPVVLGSAPVVVTPVSGGSGNVYLASISLSTLPPGNPTIIARYSGDSNYTGSDSPGLYQAVNKTPTNIVLTTSMSPSIFGNQVTFGIAVTPVPPGTGTPTGQIEIFDGTNSLGIYMLQGGTYTFTTSSLAVGNHPIGVNYKGDTNFQPFNSPSILQVVSKIPTSLNLTSNAPTAIASQIITFTAVVNPNPVPGVPFASGQVGFYDGATLMGVANLQSNAATLNVANLPVGLHSISARYLGDGNWLEAVSGFYAQTIAPATTSIQIVSSANPSVWGQPVTFTMTVTVPFPGTVPAIGQVVLQEKGNNITEPIVADNGRFTVTLSDLTPGTHNLTATFLANASFSASSSATLAQVVNKAPTVTTLAILPNNSTSKQQVTMTSVVTVPTPGAGTPSGTVEFVDTTFNKVLGKVPVKLVGGVLTAVLTTDQLVQSGSPQIITATYSGDDRFASSTSDPKGQSVFGTQITAVNGASYMSSNFAADSWVTVFGDNLANTQLMAQTVPYPTALGGTTVQITDANGTQRLAPLYFVSPGQINLVMPTGTAFGLATITVTNPNGASASSIILVTRTAPGIFSANASGTGVAAAYIQRVKSDGSQTIDQIATYNSATNSFVAVPITPGSDTLYLNLFGTGIRYVAGQTKVTCTIGGKNATVVYAGPAPGYVGLDQVSVRLPDGLSGTVNIVVTVDGQNSNTLTVAFK